MGEHFCVWLFSNWGSIAVWFVFFLNGGPWLCDLCSFSSRVHDCVFFSNWGSMTVWFVFFPIAGPWLCYLFSQRGSMIVRFVFQFYAPWLRFFPNWEFMTVISLLIDDPLLRDLFSVSMEGPWLEFVLFLNGGSIAAWLVFCLNGGSMTAWLVFFLNGGSMTVWLFFF